MESLGEKIVRAQRAQKRAPQKTEAFYNIRDYLKEKRYDIALSSKYLPGNPTIILEKQKTVIYINSCYLYGHSGCKYAVQPENDGEFLQERIRERVEKRHEEYQVYRDMGWQVIEFWECEARGSKLDRTIERIERDIEAFQSERKKAKKSEAEADYFECLFDQS